MCRMETYLIQEFLVIDILIKRGVFLENLVVPNVVNICGFLGIVFLKYLPQHYQFIEDCLRIFVSDYRKKVSDV